MKSIRKLVEPITDRCVTVADGSPLWPCPNHCEQWCRTDIQAKDGNLLPMTNHHPRCEHVDASLVDVWRVSYDGSHFYTDTEPTLENELISGVETVTRERMHREVYESLPEFMGF